MSASSEPTCEFLYNVDGKIVIILRKKHTGGLQVETQNHSFDSDVTQDTKTLTYPNTIKKHKNRKEKPKGRKSPAKLLHILPLCATKLVHPFSA